MMLGPCYAFVTLLQNSSCTAHKPQIHPSPEPVPQPYVPSRSLGDFEWTYWHRHSRSRPGGTGSICTFTTKSFVDLSTGLLVRKNPETPRASFLWERYGTLPNGGKTFPPPSRASPTECQATLSVYVLVCFVFFARCITDQGSQPASQPGGLPGINCSHL